MYDVVFHFSAYFIIERTDLYIWYKSGRSILSLQIEQFLMSLCSVLSRHKTMITETLQQYGVIHNQLFVIDNMAKLCKIVNISLIVVYLLLSCCNRLKHVLTNQNISYMVTYFIEILQWPVMNNINAKQKLCLNYCIGHSCITWTG